MTLDELGQSLQQTVAAGQIGTPVTLRMHLRLADPLEDHTDCLIAAILLANQLFQSTPARCMTRGADKLHTTLLLSFVSGATLFVTLECGLVSQASVQLLLIGNHGVANLEPAGWEGLWGALDAPQADRWRDLLRAGGRDGSAISFAE